jgi:methanethiol S-methyltransferase
MKRAAILLFGVIAYGVFFATFLYLVAFVGNLQQSGLVQWLPWLPTLVPHSIDAGRETGPLVAAVAINLGLVLLFGVQHSAMARLGFKAWLKHHLPAAAERSTYVLVASLVLALLFWQWRPLPAPAWQATSDAATWFGWALFAAGFGVVLLSTFLIDHFDLFGLRQVWRQFVGREPAAPRFSTPLLYRVVRHPLYLGFILAFWAAPTMSWGHLLFAASMTAYILVAIRFEERDLVHHLGERYVQYRENVPMLVPGVMRRKTPVGGTVSLAGKGK